MKIIIFILMGLTFIGSVPLLLSYTWDLILNVYDLIRGNCTVRQESTFTENAWKFFVVTVALFTIFLVVLVFIVLFGVIKTGGII